MPMAAGTAEPDPRRRLPPVDRLLAAPAVAALVSLYGRERTRIHARRVLAEARARLLAGDPEAAAESALVQALEAGLAAEARGGMRRVLNATGVFLHTNLGRAPLPRAVAAALPPLLDASVDLELDLAGGRRGRRGAGVGALLCELTGAADALVVNNNAAALVLALAALAAGREVVVSRGELVEIGGSFRIPEILAAAGARLVEVGTTNRTRLGDYARAISAETALLLKVSPSNYRIRGFTAEVAPEALAALARERGLPLLVDEGSGLLRPHAAPQLAEHRAIATLVGAGCDLVCGSGDKLLGGPQAGLVVGRADLVARCRSHPLHRALRLDRVRFAALEGVLRMHRDGRALPLAGMWPDPAAHRRRLEARRDDLGGAWQIVPAGAYLGGGAAPDAPLPGEALAAPGGDLEHLRLRTGDPAVLARRDDGRVVLDLRTVDPADDAALVQAVRRACAPVVGEG